MNVGIIGPSGNFQHSYGKIYHFSWEKSRTFNGHFFNSYFNKLPGGKLEVDFAGKIIEPNLWLFQRADSRPLN